MAYDPDVGIKATIRAIDEERDVGLFQRNEIICPWCGLIFKKEETPKLQEGWNTLTCGTCVRDFYLDVKISVTYSMQRKKPHTVSQRV